MAKPSLTSQSKSEITEIEKKNLNKSGTTLHVFTDFRSVRVCISTYTGPRARAQARAWAPSEVWRAVGRSEEGPRRQPLRTHRQVSGKHPSDT